MLRSDLFKKATAAILAVMMTAGILAGCSNAENKEADSTTTAAAKESKEEKATTVADDEETKAENSEDAGEAELIRDNIYTSGDQILKDKKSYTIVVAKDPNAQNGFGDKEVIQAHNEMANVDIEWMDIPDASWDEQVNIMISAGNLPDAFCGRNIKILMQNKELFVPIQDMIPVMAPHVQEMLDEDASIKSAITAPDGNIYSLPTNKANPSNAVDNMLWINPEWLEKIDKPIPTTTDEFVEILRLFRDTDMNENGDLNDEIPFQARQENDYAHNLSAIIGAFDVVLPSDYVYVKDGKNVIFGGTEPGLFDALNWLNLLYSEKLLDNETFTMDNSQQVAKAQAEDVLMGSLIYWIPDSMDMKYEDYVVVPPLKGPNGDQLWYAGGLPLGANLTGYAITTACEDPEVLLRYYDLAMKDLKTIMEFQWGPEGKGLWKQIGEDEWTQTTEFVPEGTNLTFFKRTIAPSIYGPNFIWSKYAEKEIADPRNAKKREAAQNMLQYCAETMPKAMYDPELEASRNLLFTDIDNYMKQFIATSVVNGLTDAQWEDHMKNCEKLRTEEYRSVWQDCYDSVKG